MKRIVIAVFAVAALSACSIPFFGDDTPEGLTPQAQVYALKSQFDALLEPVAAYEAQPRCTAAIVVGCSDMQIVDKMRDTVREVKRALDDAETIVRQNPDAEVPELLASIVRTGLLRLNAYLIEAGMESET